MQHNDIVTERIDRAEIQAYFPRLCTLTAVPDVELPLDRDNCADLILFLINSMSILSVLAVKPVFKSFAGYCSGESWMML